MIPSAQHSILSTQCLTHSRCSIPNCQIKQLNDCMNPATLLWCQLLFSIPQTFPILSLVDFTVPQFYVLLTLLCPQVIISHFLHNSGLKEYFTLRPLLRHLLVTPQPAVISCHPKHVTRTAFNVVPYTSFAKPRSFLSLLMFWDWPLSKAVTLVIDFSFLRLSTPLVSVTV